MGILEWIFGGTKDYRKELKRAERRLLDAVHNEQMAQKLGYGNSKNAKKLFLDVRTWRGQLDALILAVGSQKEAKKQGYRDVREAAQRYRDFTKRIDAFLRKI